MNMIYYTKYFSVVTITCECSILYILYVSTYVLVLYPFRLVACYMSTSFCSSTHILTLRSMYFLDIHCL